MKNSNNPFDGAPRDPGARVTNHLKDEADPAEIKEDIGRTRAKMDRTLDELSDRLRPRRWIEETIDAIKHSSAASSVGEAGLAQARNLCREGAEVARRHPIPAALVLGGIAWMAVEQITGEPLMGRRRHERDYGWERGPEDLSTTGSAEGMPARPRGSVTGRPVYGASYAAGTGHMAGRAGDYGESAAHSAERLSRKDRVSGAIHHTADAARIATQRARAAASGAADRISGAVHHTADRARYASDRVRHMTHDVSERASHIASDTAHRVSEGARVAQERSRETVESHPLAVAGSLFGVGLLLGVLLPSSRREDRWFGEESDEVKDTARRMGEDALERGKEIAHAVKEEAERQGLTKDELIRRGERVIETAQQETQRAVKDELSSIGQSGSAGGRKLESGQTSQQQSFGKSGGEHCDTGGSPT